MRRGRSGGDEGDDDERALLIDGSQTEAGKRQGQVSDAPDDGVIERLGKKHGAGLVQIVLVGMYVGLNVSLNVYNKWLLSPSKGSNSRGLKIPLLMTCCHALACSLTALVLSQAGGERFKVRKLQGRAAWAKVLSVSVFFSVGVGLNNSSLVLIPLSLAQMIKATHPALMAMCAFFLEGERRPTPLRLLAVAGIVCGAMLCVKGSSNKGVNPLGVAMSVGSVLSGALHIAFISVAMKSNKLKLSSLEMLYYTGLPVVALLIVPAVSTGEVAEAKRFALDNGYRPIIALITFGSMLAVMYNVVSFMFVKALSAVYLSITGSAKVVMVVLTSILFFGDPVTRTNAIGMSVALLAFVFNSYLTYREKQDDLEHKAGNDTRNDTTQKPWAGLARDEEEGGSVTR